MDCFHLNLQRFFQLFSWCFVCFHHFIVTNYNHLVSLGHHPSRANINMFRFKKQQHHSNLYNRVCYMSPTKIDGISLYHPQKGTFIANPVQCSTTSFHHLATSCHGVAWVSLVWYCNVISPASLEMWNFRPGKRFLETTPIGVIVTPNQTIHHYKGRPPKYYHTTEVISTL